MEVFKHEMKSKPLGKHEKIDRYFCQGRVINGCSIDDCGILDCYPTTKVIYLLDRFASGLGLPKRIELDGIEYKNISRSKLSFIYVDKDDNPIHLLLLKDLDYDTLNSTVKIIEM